MSAARQAGATSLGMQSENFGYSRVRLRRIKKLQFGVVNPNELVSVFKLQMNFYLDMCLLLFNVGFL